jgi:magnesium transporter
MSPPADPTPKAHLTPDELDEAWQVLSVAERIEGLRCLDDDEARTLFERLSPVDQATLLLDMPEAERAAWMSELSAEDAAEVASVASEEDRAPLLDVLDADDREEVLAQLEELEEQEAKTAPSVSELAISDVTSAQIQIYKSVDGEVRRLETIEEGAWINLVNPSAREMTRLAERLGIEVEVLAAALDEEERPRMTVEGACTLIIVDLPTQTKEVNLDVYTTIPVGIVLTRGCVLTVCLRGDTLLQDFAEGRVKGLVTTQRNRFVLQLLYRAATRYLQYLRVIDRTTHRIEQDLHGSLKNKELIQLLKLQKSLVYFSTSLKSNELVMEKLLRLENLRASEDDRELLEDVLIEHKQALEMANIYSNTLSGTMDAFASVISNNLNIVMKVLTSVTIVLAIPTMVSSFFGMNVNLPLGGHDAFAMILGGAFSLCVVAVAVLWRSRML